MSHDEVIVSLVEMFDISTEKAEEIISAASEITSLED